MDGDQKYLNIGVTNAERILFEDVSAWTLMPEMKRFRDQWSVSKISPALKPTGTAAIIDFLAAAGEKEESVLSKHFGRPVTIDKADRRCVANVEFSIISDHPDLEEMSAYTSFGCFRKGDGVYITFWR